ncbi:MAG: hypothetical protein NUW01_12120 [Gemmatimonadaceae bacterium]|nr:hypothetical protein [Gemmatimonadaceae bacterium]
MATTKTLDEAAAVYRYMLPNKNVDWTAVNTTIIERWSRSGLTYIKREAWGYPDDRDDYAREQAIEDGRMEHER